MSNSIEKIRNHIENIINKFDIEVENILDYSYVDVIIYVANSLNELNIKTTVQQGWIVVENSYNKPYLYLKSNIDNYVYNIDVFSQILGYDKIHINKNRPKWIHKSKKSL